MMFPNAHEGVKKIYVAEVLALIAAAALLLVALLGLGIKEPVNLEDGVDAGTAVTGGGILLLALAAGVIAIISLIMMIVGLNRAKLDEGAFRTALILTIVALAVSVVSTVIESSNAVVSQFISIAASVLSLGATVFVIKGIMNLAEQLNRMDMVENGNSVLRLYVILIIVGLVGSIVSGVLEAGDNQTTAMIISIASAAIGIVSAVILLSYLAKAKKMLEE